MGLRRSLSPPRGLPRSTALLLLVGCMHVLLWLRSIDAAITAASVTPVSLDAGATGDVDIAFTTGLGVPIDGRIVVVFPGAFYVAATTLSNIVGITTATLSMGSNTYTVIVTISGTAIDPATTVSFTIDGVTNPGDGTTSKYTIRTTDTSGNTRESASNIAGSAIAKTTFADATLTPSTTNAGAVLQFSVAFTAVEMLRIGSLIELQFPILASSGFIISSATVANRAGLHASSVITSTAMPFLRLTVAGQDVAAGTLVSITFGGIFSPAVHPTGALIFSIRTRHSAGTIFQETSGIVLTDLQSTQIAATATIKPTSFYAGVTTTFNINFANAAYLSTGSKITVTFPSRFNIAGATFSGISNLPTTGTTLAVTSATTMVLLLGTGTVLAGSNRGFTVSNVINPGSSCDQYIYEYCTTTWETYSISITDAANQLYEETTTVPGTPIVKKPMVFARVRPLLKQPQTLTSAVLLFTSQTTIPVGGSIDVIFPSGYTISAGVAATGHVGIPAASTVVTLTGLQISLAVAFASIPPTTTLTVTFTAITTPESTATGMYTVRTRDAQGYIMEEHDKINGEGCLYLNSCNGHGTCTLFSSTCICDPGWGAATDVATYRAPDCTKRTCPSGTSWNNLPTDATTSHDTVEECSAMGTCDRSTGRCKCFAGFVGNACQRMACPNNCRNRGRCVSMKEFAAAKNGAPLSAPTTYAGAKSSTTWDEDMVFGCLCDSVWAVGSGNGEIQVAEYFGGDCSRRHCPTGNDPETAADDTDCGGVTAPGGLVVGSSGNICHVECSNRGVCNYKSGVCRCFAGYSGYACQSKDVLSK